MVGIDKGGFLFVTDQNPGTVQVSATSRFGMIIFASVRRRQRRTLSGCGRATTFWPFSKQFAQNGL